MRNLVTIRPHAKIFRHGSNRLGSLCQRFAVESFALFALYRQDRPLSIIHPASDPPEIKLANVPG